MVILEMALEMERTLGDLERCCMFDWSGFDYPESRFDDTRHKKRVKPIKYEIPKPVKGLGFIETFRGIRYRIGNK